ncbi:hypothetical protein [Chroococcidiopsis thermalis]|nr:hypothetical protein [Chroococcidiopsis thermalis]
MFLSLKYQTAISPLQMLLHLQLKQHDWQADYLFQPNTSHLSNLE